MIKRYFLPFLLMVFLSFSYTSSAKDYAGVKVPDTIKYGGKTLQLNGVGTRTKFFIKLYVASLYLTDKSKDGEKVVAADSPMAIRIAIVSKLTTAEKMKAATLEGFKKSTKGNIAPIKTQVDQLLASFDKGVVTGDVYELINMPGSGVHVLKNGVRVAQISSLVFKQALFGIWLSKVSVQSSLRNKLLGN